MKTTKKLARLTPEESATYSAEFEYYFNNVRRNNSRADSYAWKETVKSFPRLATYAGALP